jgi:hypothetical protein
MDFDALREAIASDVPGRSRPALASLVDATPEQAEPLLLLGLQQSDMLLRQLSCSGLGHKPTPAGWEPLVHTLQNDPEVAVRAEAANALVSHGLERAWPLLLEAFQRENEWLLRCSVLSAVAERRAAAGDRQPGGGGCRWHGARGRRRDPGPPDPRGRSRLRSGRTGSRCPAPAAAGCRPPRGGGCPERPAALRHTKSPVTALLGFESH